MRKLKLQVQISVDGYVAGTNGELDWMIWDLDGKLIQFINEITDSSDTILLARESFAGGWTELIDTLLRKFVESEV